MGNPANTNAMVCAKSAPSIPVANFSCLTRLDMNRAQSMVSVPVLNFIYFREARKC